MESAAEGEAFTASPVIAADRPIVINEDGLTTILNTGDSFKILYQNDIPEETLASPAVLDGHIYIRTLTESLLYWQIKMSIKDPERGQGND